MNAKPYPKYKASGVEWLGDVPEHWTLRRLKDCGRVVGGSGFPHEEQGRENEELPFYKVGDLKLSTDGKFMNRGIHSVDFDTAKSLRASIVRPGSVIYAKIGAALLLNRRRITSVNCCIDNNMTAFVPSVKFVSTGWSYYWLTILDFGEFVNPGAVPSYSEGDQKILPMPLPPIPEQQAIADFLDDRTGKLDGLLGKKRELIVKLKEKRSALISRTVTKGLPPEAAAKADLTPNPKLKPSGIPWLGDIPVHWEAAQLRHKAYILDCKHRTVAFTDDGIPLASIREVHGSEVDLSNAKCTSEEEYSALIEGGRRPRIGDIIFSRNATVGDASLVTTEERFCMGQDVCLIQIPQHDSKFFLYLFRSVSLINQIESLMIGSTFRRINVGQIHSFVISVPPRSEQVVIAQYLDLETSKIDRMIQKVETAISKLTEYRTALITAAVTGKIDIRRFKS